MRRRRRIPFALAVHAQTGNGNVTMANKWLMLVLLAAFAAFMYFAIIWKMS